MKSLSFEIEKDEDQFHTWCSELPDCHSHGRTINETMENLKDAVHLYLDTILEEEISKKSLQLVG